MNEMNVTRNVFAAQKWPSLIISPRVHLEEVSVIACADDALLECKQMKRLCGLFERRVDEEGAIRRVVRTLGSRYLIRYVSYRRRVLRESVNACPFVSIGFAIRMGPYLMSVLHARICPS